MTESSAANSTGFRIASREMGVNDSYLSHIKHHRMTPKSGKLTRARGARKKPFPKDPQHRGKIVEVVRGTCFE